MQPALSREQKSPAMQAEKNDSVNKIGNSAWS